MTYRVTSQDPDEGEITEYFATAKECAEAIGEDIDAVAALNGGWMCSRKFQTFLGEAIVDYCS